MVILLDQLHGLIDDRPYELLDLVQWRPIKERSLADYEW